MARTRWRDGVAFDEARRTTLRRCAVLVSVAALSCGAPPGSAPRHVPPASAIVEPPHAQRLDLRAAMRGRGSHTIDETAVGMNETNVSVTITNTGSLTEPIGMLHLAFHIHRGDVELPCLPRKVDHANDAGVLPPGASFTVTTPLGCWTPVAGEYRVGVVLSFDDPSRTALRSAFEFEVEDPRGRAAHESPTHPGIFALAGGDSKTLPIQEEKAAIGQYGIALVVANVSTRAVVLPPALVSLRVFRIGDPLPCVGETFARSLPPLAPGAVEVVHVPVTCVRDKLGDYLVRIQLAFLGEDDPSSSEAPSSEAHSFEAGRVRVRVTREAGAVPLW